jgi:NAD(P)-dependent dehydrogenase (short-subunit alcohol dehydrogenase family)
MSDMRGKTVLVTGANQGIGKASAHALGRMGARLVLVCRNEEKARATIAELERDGIAGVELIVADMGSQADIRRVAADVRAKHDRLDVLLNNAGVLVTTRRTTMDGIEETFAVNHLGYFLLTNLLLDLLRATGPARIVNVASEAHRSAHIHWRDIELSRGYTSFGAYGQSKLCNILFTQELARRLEGTAVTANCAHPGAVASGFGHTYGGITSLLLHAASPFLLSPERGARTQVWLASSPEVDGVTGKYFARCKEKTPSRAAREPEAPRRLWAISERMTGLGGGATAAA